MNFRARMQWKYVPIGWRLYIRPRKDDTRRFINSWVVEVMHSDYEYHIIHDVCTIVATTLYPND